MTREISFNNGIIDGDCMRFMLLLFPVLKDSFSGRKHYDEYYFKPVAIEVGLWELNTLSNEYSIKISNSEIEILLD